MPAIDNLLRHVLNNRRHQPRRRHVYDTVIRSERNMVLFRGKTVNISQSGARLVGLPTDLGVLEGDRILVEFTIPPSGRSMTIRRVSTVARVIRLIETADSFTVAIKFEYGIHL